jgi:hypothetical protein
MALPVSEAVPAEAISAQLSSADGRHRLEIARARINVFRIRVDEPPLDLGVVGADLASKLSDIATGEEAAIGRLATVATSFAESPTPAMEMARHFFQERWLRQPLNRPQQLEVHSHKVFQLAEELRVNSWVRVKSANRAHDLSPIVVVEEDINTLEEERAGRSFSADEVARFFALATAEFSTILGLYFPDVPEAQE